MNEAAKTLEDALFKNGQAVPIDRIEISIIAGARFRWSLWSGEVEIFAGQGDADEVAGMTRATKQLVNTQLGVRPETPPPSQSLN